ncbi:CLIP domain-containing serine protease B4-like [Culex pipiens pallens]|uniref:CLIP domain-containing serine protease B4-like n=1 Tax=Culex pipiens pallens TaxID=42434 RepID=UPI0022AA2574|nr:CLIP domain-containing serine protease B4-like [Culex pipiens pallens]
MIQTTKILLFFEIFVLIAVLCNGQPTKSTLPSRYQCGHANSPKILLGPGVSIGEMSWTALIQYRKPNGDQSFDCAGSLINERYVLTAAHCVSGIPRAWTIVGVRLGEHDLSTDQDCEQDGPDRYCADAHQDLPIEKIIVHEDYNRTKKNYLNDIALIRLERDVIFSEYINPICLPVDDEDRQRNITGQRAVEVGWSGTNEYSDSNIRKKSFFRIQDHQSCNEGYKTRGVTLSDSQLCASREYDDSDCHAIEGSPLMQAVGGRTHFLYGISSFGPDRCGTNGTPDVFTNVAKFVDWIESKLE